MAGPDNVDDRIIAPVPDKSDGLKQVFVRDTYAKALALVRSSGTLVSIGYSFNDHDCLSYERLLQALAESSDRRLVIACPDAHTIAKKLRSRFPLLSIEPVDKTFKEWVVASFPGCPGAIF
jgi:hypothetical protein